MSISSKFHLLLDPPFDTKCAVASDCSFLYNGLDLRRVMEIKKCFKSYSYFDKYTRGEN